MSALRVAVVGAGWMGGRHASAVELAGDVVSAVVDTDRRRAESLAQGLRSGPAAVLDDVAGLSVDAAIVTTPTASHSRLSRRLLDRGVAVLVEKPHRLPSEDPWQSRPGDPLCWVGMSTRFLQGVMAIKSAIDEGVLGEIRLWADRIWFRLDPEALAPWYFDPSLSGGGVLTTNGVHALDRVEWMLGELEVDSSYLGSVSKRHETEDLAWLSGRAAGARVTISLLWAPGNVPRSELVVVGTDGTAVSRLGNGWEIDARDHRESGVESNDEEPFRLQWRAFREELLGGTYCGPTPDRLESVMAEINSIYEVKGGRSWS